MLKIPGDMHEPFSYNIHFTPVILEKIFQTMKMINFSSKINNEGGARPLIYILTAGSVSGFKDMQECVCIHIQNMRLAAIYLSPAFLHPILDWNAQGARIPNLLLLSLLYTVPI
jgi:hypothetical protein